MVVFFPRTLYSALALIVCFGATAGLFFQLGAEFVAAIQVIIYAGAIMVLFLFVIMLLDPDSESFPPNRLRKTSMLALPLAAIFLAGLLPILTSLQLLSARSPASTGDSVEIVARSLFRDYLLPFEVTSILMLVAILGAVILTRRTS